jgi:hypothetical protein
MRKTSICLLACGFIAAFSVRAAAGPEIWLAPLNRTWTINNRGSGDYMDLFQNDAPWGSVAQRVSAFKLYPYFTGRSTDAELKSVIDNLRQRNIALALEARVLTSTANCQGDGGASTLNLLRRIRRLGGDVRYLAMDEPLKHWHSGRAVCSASFDEVAENIAGNVQNFRTIFPNLQVGDIEPVGEWAEAPQLLEDLTLWVDAYSRRAREDLAFFHADVGWRVPWTQIVSDLGTRLRELGIPFGIICNGEDLAQSDKEWSLQALEHVRAYRGDYYSAPDTIVFQSWVGHPSRVLPETDPLSLTGIVKCYLDGTLVMDFGNGVRCLPP